MSVINRFEPQARSARTSLEQCWKCVRVTARWVWRCAAAYWRSGERRIRTVIVRSCQMAENPFRNKLIDRCSYSERTPCDCHVNSGPVGINPRRASYCSTCSNFTMRSHDWCALAQHASSGACIIFGPSVGFHDRTTALWPHSRLQVIRSNLLQNPSIF